MPEIIHLVKISLVKTVHEGSNIRSELGKVAVRKRVLPIRPRIDVIRKPSGFIYGIDKVADCRAFPFSGKIIDIAGVLPRHHLFCPKGNSLINTVRSQ